ncbi:TonB-dependent receptor [Peristeroidobacter soli]|uniref:TonB-dependent receptor n=1 Tax=Peristeroidobacter soli TaxID=2497877 RepID=UPI00101CACBA|nr:TonB-dependent receptor [Peristeroidobacter soli]
MGTSISPATWWCTALALLNTTGQVHAQDALPSGLEEIVVTARKREENLQTAPVSVTALTSAALERQGIDTIVDLGSHVPNLSMISGQGGGGTQTQVSIRGVGQSDFILTSDQSVGVYVDGVYLPRSMGAALDLVDVARIEVLRGPQGTLFGRNTTAGAIQILSAPPEDALFGKAELTTGSFQRLDFKGSINVPLSEKVATRISVASLNQDGYGKRFFNGTDGGDNELLAGRAAFRAELTDQLRADLILDYSRKRGFGGLERLVRIDPTDPNLAFYNSMLVAQGLAPADGRYITSDVNDTWSGARNRDDNEMGGASLTLDWSGDAVNLKSITAWRTMEVESAYDFDGTPYPLSEQELNLDQEQFSQELQLSGTAVDGKLQWMTGAFYFSEDASDYQNVPFYQPVVATGGGGFQRVPGGFSFASFISQETRSYAAYGQATWHFNDRWSTTAGLRYTDEEKTLDSYLTGAFGRAPGTVKDSWSDLSPRLGFEYRISDRAMTYVCASRGFRSGGFNGRNTSPNPPQAFDPETIWAYEVGLKTESDDRTVRFNSALFYYDYSDFQGLTLDSFSGITITVGNIAKVEMYGAEFDLAARPTDNLQLSLAAGYTHQDIAEVAPGAQITIRPDTKLVNAPEWTATAAVDYTVPMGKAGDLDLHLDYGWKSDVEFFLPNYPDEGQESYGLLNARIGYKPEGSWWRVEVFGDNLANEEYRVFAENGTSLGIPATTAIYGRPREWGLRFRAEFD